MTSGHEAPCSLPAGAVHALGGERDEFEAGLGDRVERALRANPQYAYGRDLGQLGPSRVVEVVGPVQRYQAWALARGQRLGDIKPPSLRPETDWERRMGR